MTRGIREPDGHVTGDPAADESRGVRDCAGPCVPSRAFPPTCRMAFRSSVVNDHGVAQDTLFDSPLPCEVGSRLRAFRRRL